MDIIMKKFFKTLFTVASAAAVIGGVYYCVKNYILDDDLSDFDDDLSDLNDDFDFDEDDDFSPEKDSKEYVTLDLSSATPDEEESAEEVSQEAAEDEASVNTQDESITD